MAGDRQPYQTTLAQTVTLEGIGVHTGGNASLTLHPADPDTGICFTRGQGRGSDLAAAYDEVTATERCTTLGHGDRRVTTVEHVMAALRGLDVDNAIIEVDGAEVPILDGSAAPFVDAVDRAGRVRQRARRRHIRVLEPVRVEDGLSYAELRPYDGFRLDVTIDFVSPVIGAQRYTADMDETSFRDDLARARTFGLMSDVEQMWRRGMALGASLENAVMVGDDTVINPEGLRFADEFVRHKALDAVGDLALAGAPILGAYESHRGGHKLNVMMVEALLGRDQAWTFAEAPVRAPVGHADLPAGVGVPAYGPDVS